MAERLRKRHQDDIRTKIKVSNIIDRLEKHVNGEIEMTPAQVTSARILLDKTISNAPTDINANVDASVTVEIVRFGNNQTAE
jgi:hypothetical protein